MNGIKLKTKLLLTLTICLSLAACDQSPTKSATDKSSAAAVEINLENNLQAHIEFLADDYLLGRDTGSKQYEIAARYVASHFKQFGMKPAGDNNTWFQSVPFIKSQVDKSSIRFNLHTNGADQSLSYPDEFIMGSNPNSSEDSVTAQLVFVGYGINSPELKHNDYADIDVKDKIVVLLSGKPQSFPSEIGAHVSSGDEKSRHAAEQGAIGIIALHTPQRDKVRTYEKILPFIGKPSFHWQKADGTAAGTQAALKVNAYLSKAAGVKLFKAANADLEKIFAEIEAEQIPQAFSMDLEVSMQRKTKHDKVKSSNVAGIVEGSDPVLKNEYVVYSAHLDHIGTGGMVKDDDHINNGALDNSSGTAVMLETARQFSLQKKPKRSILFLAVTGEEKGLLGSEYFATNPTVAKDAMVANINLDMPLILYPFADVIAFGSEHSTLAGYVSRAAKAQGLKLSPDPMPEQNIFVRSDHYSFVKQGIPSIFLVPGFESKQEGIDGQKVFQDFFVEHYHQPTDDAHLPINYSAGATFARVNFQIGTEIANDENKPSWNENNFFGDTFSKNNQQSALPLEQE
jgi:Zn-dependent M28 family amino/carboxypeptidase